MAEASYVGSLKHLNTDAMYEAVQKYEEAVQSYEGEVNSMKKIVDKLLDTWEGEGKKAFEKDYILFSRQLEDLMEVLMDLRINLVDAETEFLDADAMASKAMACALTGGK